MRVKNHDKSNYGKRQNSRYPWIPWIYDLGLALYIALLQVDRVYLDEVQIILYLCYTNISFWSSSTFKHTNVGNMTNTMLKLLKRNCFGTLWSQRLSVFFWGGGTKCQLILCSSLLLFSCHFCVCVSLTSVLRYVTLSLWLFSTCVVCDFDIQLRSKTHKLHFQHLDQSMLLDFESPSSLIGLTDIKVTFALIYIKDCRVNQVMPRQTRSCQGCAFICCFISSQLN